MRQWGIRPKLVAVVVIPTVAALVFGSLQMASAFSAGATYSRVKTLAQVQPQLNTLVRDVQLERTGAAGLVSTPALEDLSAITSGRAATNAAVTAFRESLVRVDASHDEALRTKLSNAISNLARLPALRASADAHNEGATTAMSDYTQVVQSLMTVTDELATQRSNSAVTRRVSSLQAVSDSQEAVSQQQGIIYSAALSGSLTDAAYQQLIKANAAQYIGVVTLLDGVSAAGQAQYRSILGADAVGAADAVISRVLSTRSATDIGLTPVQWLAASGVQLNGLAQIQNDQASQVSKLVDQLSQSARTSALVSAVFIFLVLAFALLATLIVARSILRPLRALRAAALGVAYEDLPATVRRLQQALPSEDALVVAPINVTSRDEIGQVARAFDAVHVEAVQLAGQQALMRGNVNKMFINLSRRSQSLVERQLRLIDELEAGERDADQLANLFKLDHLATRMRRNDENLLVLAGDEGARRRSEPVQMLDVLRAASGEVEQYGRVQLDAQAGFLLSGAAVNDVVHLIAELVENATTFSSPSTLVWVRAHSLGVSGEMVVEVEDHGIGMGAAELAAANDKLAAASGIDVSMSRLMGLFVVGRLAQRHNIGVVLRPSAYGGVTAFVRVPAILISSPAGELVAAPVMADEVHLEPENSPIFEKLQSEWFNPRRTLPAQTVPAPVAPDAPAPEPEPVRVAPAADPVPAYANGTPAPVTPLAPPTKPVVPPVPPKPAVPDWTSPGDQGWQAVADLRSRERASAPALVTATGLPVRVPGRNLLPGTAADSSTNGNGTNGTNGNGANGANGNGTNGADKGAAAAAPAPTSRLAQGLSSYQRGVNRGRGLTDEAEPAAATPSPQPAATTRDRNGSS